MEIIVPELWRRRRTTAIESVLNFGPKFFTFANNVLVAETFVTLNTSSTLDMPRLRREIERVFCTSEWYTYISGMIVDYTVLDTVSRIKLKRGLAAASMLDRNLFRLQKGELLGQQQSRNEEGQQWSKSTL